MVERAILIVYTGGTIGMKTNPETGSLAPFNFDQIELEVPELKKIGVKVDTYTFDPIIDSANVNPRQWERLAHVIKENYAHYDGFVVLHGTDTMAYTASAFSFMMQNLDKSIIFTGSQIPIGVLRTDGKENLITAVEIAAARNGTKTLVPEVCIYFENKLFRANRTTKDNADHFNAFRSYNYPLLAEAGIDIHYYNESIRKVDAFLPSFDISTGLCPNVIILKLFPGITEQSVHAMFSIPQLQGVVLETYGTGNAPMDDWFVNQVEAAIAKGILVLNVTQCNAGTVNMELYDTGRTLAKIGVINGKDITSEAAVTKMMHLLACDDSIERVRQKLSIPIRGEQSW